MNIIQAIIYRNLSVTMSFMNILGYYVCTHTHMPACVYVISVFRSSHLKPSSSSSQYVHSQRAMLHEQQTVQATSKKDSKNLILSCKSTLLMPVSWALSCQIGLQYGQFQLQQMKGGGGQGAQFVLRCHQNGFAIAGVIFTSLPTPPEDLYVAESYIHELDMFTGQLQYSHQLSCTCTSILAHSIHCIYSTVMALHHKTECAIHSGTQ